MSIAYSRLVKSQGRSVYVPADLDTADCITSFDKPLAGEFKSLIEQLGFTFSKPCVKNGRQFWQHTKVETKSREEREREEQESAIAEAKRLIAKLQPVPTK